MHRKDFSDFVCSKENLKSEKTFVYLAPPFQSNNPTKDEEKRKEGYDRFVDSLRKEGIVVREGRCQRLKIGDKFKYTQKAVDVFLTMDLMRVLNDFSEIKKIIFVASDSDFVPVIQELYSKGIKTILYTYYDKDRNSRFSRSNHLIKSVHKYVKLTKEDFLEIVRKNEK